MNDDTAVAEEGFGARLCGGVEFEVGGLEGHVACDLAVPAAEVADLTCFGLRGIAGWCFAAQVGVQVAERSGAVAISGDGVDVDVVDYVG